MNLLGRDLSRVVYFDSKPLSYWLHPNNSFCLDEFKADMTMKNQDLDYILLEIEELRKAEDVRIVLKERFDSQDTFRAMNLLK